MGKKPLFRLPGLALVVLALAPLAGWVSEVLAPVAVAQQIPSNIQDQTYNIFLGTLSLPAYTDLWSGSVAAYVYASDINKTVYGSLYSWVVVYAVVPAGTPINASGSKYVNLVVSKSWSIGAAFVASSSCTGGAGVGSYNSSHNYVYSNACVYTSGNALAYDYWFRLYVANVFTGYSYNVSLPNVYISLAMSQPASASGNLSTSAGSRPLTSLELANLSFRYYSVVSLPATSSPTFVAINISSTAFSRADRLDVLVLDRSGNSYPVWVEAASGYAVAWVRVSNPSAVGSLIVYTGSPDYAASSTPSNIWYPLSVGSATHILLDARSVNWIVSTGSTNVATYLWDINTSYIIAPAQASTLYIYPSLLTPRPTSTLSTASWFAVPNAPTPAMPQATVSFPSPWSTSSTITLASVSTSTSYSFNGTAVIATNTTTLSPKAATATASASSTVAASSTYTATISYSNMPSGWSTSVSASATTSVTCTVGTTNYPLSYSGYWITSISLSGAVYYVYGAAVTFTASSTSVSGATGSQTQLTGGYDWCGTPTNTWSISITPSGSSVQQSASNAYQQSGGVITASNGNRILLAWLAGLPGTSVQQPPAPAATSPSIALQISGCCASVSLKSLSPNTPPGYISIYIPVENITAVPILPSNALRVQTRVYSNTTIAPHLYNWYFDGVDDYVQAPYTSVFNQSPFTVMGTMMQAVIKIDNTLLGACDAYTTDRCLSLIIRSGYPFMGFYVDDLASGTYIGTGVWVNLAFVWGGPATMVRSIYVNGALAANGTSSGLLTVTSGSASGNGIWIGRWGSYTHSGYIQQVLIYSRVLSASEINNTYYNNIINTSGLVLFLDATFYNGTAYIDLSGNNNNGVPYNGVLRVPSQMVFLYTMPNTTSNNQVVLRFFPAGSLVAFRSATTGSIVSTVYITNTSGTYYPATNMVDNIVVGLPGSGPWIVDALIPPRSPYEPVSPAGGYRLSINRVWNVSVAVAFSQSGGLAGASWANVSVVPGVFANLSGPLASISLSSTASGYLTVYFYGGYSATFNVSTNLTSPQAVATIVFDRIVIRYSQAQPVAVGSYAQIQGTATYESDGAPVPSGTLTFTDGYNIYRCAISNGRFSCPVLMTAPGTYTFYTVAANDYPATTGLLLQASGGGFVDTYTSNTAQVFVVQVVPLNPVQPAIGFLAAGQIATTILITALGLAIFIAIARIQDWATAALVASTFTTILFVLLGSYSAAVFTLVIMFVSLAFIFLRS